jgi:hypothetical protein
MAVKRSNSLVTEHEGLTLARKPGRLKPIDSAAVLQRDSEPSSDFMPKILRVETPHNFHDPMPLLEHPVASM